MASAAISFVCPLVHVPLMLHVHAQDGAPCDTDLLQPQDTCTLLLHWYRLANWLRLTVSWPTTQTLLVRLHLLVRCRATVSRSSYNRSQFFT